MKIILIAAMADNRVIGIDGKLPWNNPEDLANFKKLTTGGTIVMGRKTYESIGRPLPNRRNIVLSTGSLNIPGVEVFSDIASMMQVLESDGIDSIYIIGGQKIYETFLSQGWVDEIMLSKIPGDYTGDTYLAEFETNFILIQSEDFATFTFMHYRKQR